MPAALECLAEALDLCEEVGDSHQLWSVWNCLTATLMMADFPELALTAADVAIANAEEIEPREMADCCLASTLGNAAQLCLSTKQFGRGLRSAKRSLSIIAGNPLYAQSAGSEAAALTNRAHGQWTHGRLLLRVGSLHEAEKCAAEMERLVGFSPKNIRVAWLASLMRATINVHAGRIDEGFAQLKSCLGTAHQISPELEADALREIAQAYRHIGKDDRAAKCMSELSQHLKRARGEDALFHHRRHIEQSAARIVTSDDSTRRLPSKDRTRQITRSQRDWRIWSRLEVLESLGTVAELHDDPSGKHPYRVGELSANLAYRVGIDAGQCEQISLAARLHDLGKIGTPAEILRKPGSLDNSELQIVREHAVTGAELLASAHDLDCREIAVAIARHHHEWWSGAGYPDGLAGESIPIAARVVALAEVFDALTHDRPYRPRLSVDRALELITERAGYQFDPNLVPPFCSMIRELRSNHGELDPHLERTAEQSTFLNAKRRLTERLKRLPN